MTVLTETITELTIDDFGDVVAEMANDSTATIDVPIDQGLLSRYLALDPEPHDCKFVTVEIKSGFSKSKRNWRPEILEGIAKQINEQHPVGNKGHIKKEDYDSSYPDPQTVWLGATCTRKGNQAVLKVKGYNLPNSDIRNHLQFKAVNGVSVYGKSKLRPIAGGHEVMEFDLETIDWSRKNRSGMEASVVAVTSENETLGGNTVDAKDIAALNEDELRAHAPLLVQEIERKAVTPLDEKVGEMTKVVDASKPDVDAVAEIRKLLKLEEGDNVVEKVTAFISRVEESAKDEIKSFIRELVGKKVKTERGQGLVLRLVGEMETQYEGPLTDELKKEIEADFDKLATEDEDVKSVIGEMSSGSDDDRQRTGGAALGGKSRAGEERGRVGAGENSKTRQQGTVTIQRRRFGA
jgi:hypothetical protein